MIFIFLETRTGPSRFLVLHSSSDDIERYLKDEHKSHKKVSKKKKKKKSLLFFHQSREVWHYHWDWWWASALQLHLVSVQEDVRLSDDCRLRDKDKAFPPSGQFLRSKTGTKAADLGRREWFKLVEYLERCSQTARRRILNVPIWTSCRLQLLLKKTVGAVCAQGSWNNWFLAEVCACRPPLLIWAAIKRKRQRKRERDTHRGVQFKTHKEGLRHFGWSWELHQNKQPWPSGFWWQIQPAMVGHPWTAHLNSASWIIQKSVASTLW